MLLFIPIILYNYLVIRQYVFKRQNGNRKSASHVKNNNLQSTLMEKYKTKNNNKIHSRFENLT